MTGTTLWEQANARRSEALRGRRLENEHRAAQHATKMLGSNEQTEAWWDAYNTYLKTLEDRDALADAIENDPDAASKLTVIVDKIRYFTDAETTYSVDVERLAQSIRRGTLDDRLDAIAGAINA